MCFGRIVSYLYDDSEMSVYKLTRKFELCLTDVIIVKLMKNIQWSFGGYERKTFGTEILH